VPKTYELEADSLEDAIRQLITEAAGGDVDIHLRTRGFDPRRTGTTVLRAEVAGDQNDDRGGHEEREDEAPRERAERAPRAPKSRDSSGDDAGPTVEELDEEADVAADFLEGLLDAMDLPGDISIKILDDAAIVEIVEGDSGAMIGRRGQTLESIQELARCSLQRELQRRTRGRIDIEGYRERRIEKLLDKADEVIDDVLANGGGVTASYFEWAQARQGYPWDEDMVSDRHHRVMSDAFTDVWAAGQRWNVSLRRAAYAVALERVASTMEARGIFP
jgi:predicted RNA-binding protein Jag